MKNLKRSIVAMLVIIAIFASSIVTVSAAGTQPSKYSKEYNSGERGVVCTTLSGTSAASYYTGSYTYDRLDDLSGNTLTTTLRTLMTSTHSYKSSYNDCHYMANRTDCENETGSANKLLLLYTSYTATQSQWNGWNREHVWPQSLGGGNTSGGGADLHHIRPSDAVVNSTRGNKKYGNTNGGTAKYGSNPASGYLGGYYNSTYFEPVDAVKGDVARICLYVLVRWGSAWGADSITEVFQSVDVLLEWCALDPVDTWEMGRNEVIEDIQGNRNVFIDYPELAWLLFDRAIPEDMVTPSGEAANQDGNNQGGNQGGTDTPSGGNQGGDTTCTTHTWGAWVTNTAGTSMTRTCTKCSATETKAIEPTACTHTELGVKNNKSATCGTTGYTGDTYCLACGEVLANGETIPMKDTHSWSDMVITTEPTPEHGGEGTYTCLDCGKINTVAIAYRTNEEKIIFAITFNTVYALLNDYLTKA